jgi:hypothetical protein
MRSFYEMIWCHPGYPTDIVKDIGAFYLLSPAQSLALNEKYFMALCPGGLRPGKLRENWIVLER